MARNILLGFGGSGAYLLSFAKELAHWNRGRVEDVRFLLFDTIRDWQPGAQHKIQGGRETETIAKAQDSIGDLDTFREYIQLEDSQPTLNDTLTNPSEHVSVRFRSWLHHQLLAGLVPPAARTLEEGAAQQRQIGRYAMFRNVGRILETFQELLESTGQSRVWLVASAAGGTGAGCLLDAALLVRRAALNKGVPPPSVKAVVVLPAVYTGVAGVDRARAYALFRELNRLQTIGFADAEDYYGSSRIATEVKYDDGGALSALVQAGGLFDRVFYVGAPCDSKDKRTTFFTSVAAAIEPHVDPVIGPVLAEAANNVAAGNVASFGASRVYLPAETLKGMFAWESVLAVVEQLTAPVVQSAGQTKQVVDVEAGRLPDRVDSARTRFTGLLRHFERLLQLSSQDAKTIAAVARSIDPYDLVQTQLQYADPAAAGFEMTATDLQTVRLTYCNPYVSLTDLEQDVKPADRRVKTFEEDKEVGVKKTLETSRDDFARTLGDINKVYRNPQGPQGSFARGAAAIKTTITAALQRKIDAQIQAAFNATAVGIGASRTDGTVLTRTYKELEALLFKDGPIRQARRVTKELKDEADRLETERADQAVQAQANLRRWQPPLIGKKRSLSTQQAGTLVASADAIRAYQGSQLLGLIDELLSQVEARYTAWYDELHRILQQLSLLPGDQSVWGLATSRVGILETRLGYQASNPQVFIDPVNALDGKTGDVNLHGYCQLLRQQTTRVAAAAGGHKTLAEDWIERVRWHAGTGPSPSLRLHRGQEGQTEHAVSQTIDLSNLAGDLSTEFRERIAAALSGVTIYDYLRHCYDSTGRPDPVTVGGLLKKLAEPLITVDVGTEETYFLHPAERNNDHRIYQSSVAQAVGLGANVREHADQFSLGVLRFMKPTDPSQVHDIKNCQSEYLVRQAASMKAGQQEYNDNLRRAAAFHVFRAELEAWYVERKAILEAQQQPTSDSEIVPRVVRLLEDPQQFQCFVECLAARAVDRDDGGWYWKKADGQVLRLNSDEERSASLLRAAVNFVLRKAEGIERSLRPITREDAKRSAAEAAKSQSKSLPELLKAFIDPGALRSFLDRAFPDHGRPTYRAERAALERVIQFYGDPSCSTSLDSRTV